MLVLAVETSCDDTAAALLDGPDVLSERVSRQTVHDGLGGVVPELASRMHLEVLPGMVDSIVSEAGTTLAGVDTFAASAGPGLVGALLVGLSWAKAAAFAAGARFLAINHIASHLMVLWPGEDVRFPAVALIASGGHTALFLMRSWMDAELLGATRDDAAGEAFDKTAKMIGLGYPGGAALDRLADSGDPRAVRLPVPLGDPGIPEFSFSGLKTAVRLEWERGAAAEDIAASFRSVVAGTLAAKTLEQASAHGALTVMAAGGVSANSSLRAALADGCGSSGRRLLLPEPGLATDNAVMVGRAAAAVLHHDPDARSSMSANAFARMSGRRLHPLAAG